MHFARNCEVTEQLQFMNKMYAITIYCMVSSFPHRVNMPSCSDQEKERNSGCTRIDSSTICSTPKEWL